MDFTRFLTDPFILLLAATAFGLIIGEIKIGSFQLGNSGALFAGLAISHAAVVFGRQLPADAPGYDAVQKMMERNLISNDLFTVFVVLFVAAVGLLAARDIGTVIRKYGLKFVCLGFVITLSGALAAFAVGKVSGGISFFEASGIYNGALTSSPGLAAALEFSIPDAKAAVGLAYALAYPFGVLVVIVFVNAAPWLLRMDMRAEKAKYHNDLGAALEKGAEAAEETPFDAIGFVTACFAGYLLGQVKIPLPFVGEFSLGATGGVLIGSLVLGYIGRISFVRFVMDAKVLGAIRDMALNFFLAIVGLQYGYKVVESLSGEGLMIAVWSFLVGLVAMIAGFIVGRFVFKLNWIVLSGAICGGMTSTPGLGAAINSAGSDDPATGYGATYPFALFGMVIFTILMQKGG